MLSPSAPFGTLLISNTLVLQPGSFTSVAISGAANTCGEVAGLSSVTYGSTLTINNQSGSLHGGNAFKLFNAASYNGVFAKIVSILARRGPGLGRTATLAIDGMLRITATNAPVMTSLLVGSQMTVSWPASNTGAGFFQAQTNFSDAAGLTANNWSDRGRILRQQCPCL